MLYIKVKFVIHASHSQLDFILRQARLVTENPMEDI